MHTPNCLHCEKVFENMKGYYMIVVNKPKDELFSFPLKVVSSDRSIEIEIMPGAVYIAQTYKPIEIYASFYRKISSKPYSLTINPDEFTHIEIDYEYSMFKNRYIVDKILFKTINHKKFTH